MKPRRQTSRRLLFALAFVVPGAVACGDDSVSTASTTTTTADGAATTESAARSTTTTTAAAASASSTTRVFEAENGAIEIPTDPRRIVACGYAVLPLLQAEANLVGICEWNRELDDMTPDQRTAYDALPKVGPDGNAREINYEAIAAADPDLIIMGVPAAFLTDVDVPALEQLAPVVAVGPRLPGDWRTVNPQYADAAGVKDAYASFIDEYESLAADMKTRYAALDDRTFGGVCTNCPGDAGMFRRSYASGFPTNLFDDLGFRFPGEPADPSAAPHGEWISIEQAGASFADIDVIVYGVEPDGSVPDAAAQLFESPLWAALPAVQAGNVVAVRHYAASTHATALLALRAIDEELAKLPAFVASG